MSESVYTIERKYKGSQHKVDLTSPWRCWHLWLTFDNEEVRDERLYDLTSSTEWEYRPGESDEDETD